MDPLRTVRRMDGEITLAGRKFKLWQLLSAVGIGAVLFWPRRAAAETPGTTLVNVTDRKQWAMALYQALTNILPHLSPQAKALVIAQAALETGYPPYRKDSAARCNNVFNITTGSKWLADGKPFCVGGDTTYSQLGPDGKPLPIVQKWRSYPSLEEALADYWQFLGSKISYKTARDALERADIAEFARLLRAGGYYDAPLDLYVGGLRARVAAVKQALPFIG